MITKSMLKRFSNKLNLYLLEDETIIEEYEENSNLSLGVVEEVACEIIEKKILNNQVVTLTKTEEFALKKYMILIEMKLFGIDGVLQLLKVYSNGVEIYSEIEPRIAKLKKIENIDLTDKGLYRRCIRIIEEANSFDDILNNKLTPQELCLWLMPLDKGFLSFWDAPKNKEFVLNGGCFLHDNDISHYILQEDVDKETYLDYMSMDNDIYSTLLSFNATFNNNAMLLPLTKTRLLAIINPFFKLYNRPYCFKNKLTVPDIWPSGINDKKLFDMPDYQSGDDERYIYRPKKMRFEDYIYYMNCYLELTGDDGIVVFDNPMAILDAVDYFNYQEKQGGKAEDVKFTSLLEYLLEFGKPEINSQELNEMKGFKLFEAFFNNKYIILYIYDNLDDEYIMEHLSFIGDSAKVRQFIKQRMEYLNLC